MVVNLFTERSQIQTILLESCTKEILTQINWQVLFCSRAKSVTYAKYQRYYWKTVEGCTKGACRLSEQWLRNTVLECTWVFSCQKYNSSHFFMFSNVATSLSLLHIMVYDWKYSLPCFISMWGKVTVLWSFCFWQGNGQNINFLCCEQVIVARSYLVL